MKRVLLGLVFTLVITLTGVTGVNAATSEKCFNFDKDTKTITGYKYGSKISGNNYCFEVEKLDIPKTIEGITVERIGEEALMGNEFTSVIIPNTVKSIGAKAFMNNYITSATIPSSVTNIGYAAFNDNPMKKFITDPNDSTKLVSVAYASDVRDDPCGNEPGCNQITIKVPSNIKTVGTKAFYGMRVESIILNNSVEVLESKALVGAHINSISLSKNLKSADLTLNYSDFFNEIDGQKMISHYWCANDSIMNVQTVCPYTFNNYKDPNFSGDKYYLNAYYNSVPNDVYLEVEQTAYNKVKLDYSDQGGFDQVEIWKYDYKKKKYYLYTTTDNAERKTVTKNINLGERHKFKVRFVYRNTPYFTDGTVDGTKGGVLKKKTFYSEYSDADSVVVRLGVPKSVKAKRAGSKKAKISWKKVDGATGYRVYKLDRKAKKYKSVGVTKKTSLVTKKKTKKGEKAWYKVKAYRTVKGKNIYSNFSNKVSVKIK